MLARSPKFTRESVIELARSVPQGSALKLEQATMDGLRKAYDEVAAEYAALCRAHHEGRHVSSADLKRLEPDLADLRSKIQARRTAVVKLRLARSQAVAQALAGVRKEAAERVLAALQELDEASTVLITACEEIRLAGDHDQPHLNFVPSFQMREHATRIAGA